MSKPYVSMDPQELRETLIEQKQRYDEICRSGRKLDLTRGKPGSEQLALSMPMFQGVDALDFQMDGVDVRNYGVLGGLASTRLLFAELTDTTADEVFIGGNSSLQLMYSLIAKAYTNGLVHSPRPWSQEPLVKFLCPAPGYDRHFRISESFGMELIPIPMREDGPDMKLVKKYVRDKRVKGMWCVPKYSNPDGIVYSDEVCRQIASLKPAAPDFMLVWDNAYFVHAFDGVPAEIPNILSLCREHDNADMPYMFCSTSKITFPGSGISAMITSKENLQRYRVITSAETIGYSKINEYLHVRFLPDKAHVLMHMQKHAEILKPKFDAVLSALDQEIAPLKIAAWNAPKGGYFISLYAMPHTAQRVHALCTAAGVLLTPAGATYPCGNDPDDSNIRIAPTYASLDEVKSAMEVLCICLKLAALEHLSA